MDPAACGLNAPLVGFEMGGGTPFSPQLTVVPEGMVTSLLCRCGARIEALIVGPREDSMPQIRPFAPWVEGGLYAAANDARLVRWCRKHQDCEVVSASASADEVLTQEVTAAVLFMASLQFQQLPEEQSMVQLLTNAEEGLFIIGAPTAGEGGKPDQFHLRVTQFVVRETVRQFALVPRYAVIWMPRAVPFMRRSSNKAVDSIAVIVANRRYAARLVIARDESGCVSVVDCRHATLDERIMVAGMLVVKEFEMK
jgi:hypothetical protein